MVTSFFPASFQVATKFAFGSFLLNDLLFPEETLKVCPEIEVSEGRIRQPTLGIAALVGIGIGFGGGIKLQQQQKKSYFYWQVAFIAFGTMSLSAIILHCLVPSPSNYHHHQQQQQQQEGTTRHLCLLQLLLLVLHG